MSTDKKVVFLLGKKVNLRPFSVEDVAILTRWINDPEVRRFLSSVTPKTHQQEEGWLASLDSREGDIVLGVETKEGELIGSMGIHRINWVDRTATTGALIGEKEYWGKGFGTDAKMYLLDYAFHVLGLRRICSEVIEFNERSFRYSLRCGYKEEGRKRKHVFRDGKFWDMIQLGLLFEEWLPVWEKYKEAGERVTQTQQRHPHDCSCFHCSY